MQERAIRPISETDQSWEDLYYTSRDGLRLHARHYPAPASPRRTLLCLPGLSRNARDFQRIAGILSSPAAHRRAVYCLDYRGRGLSEYDPDWENYTPFMEALDVLDFITMHGLHDLAVLGTSRGGIIAMILATMRPGALGCVILNDIGPKLETDGLARIIGYVGRVPVPDTWEDAAELVRGMNVRDFPDVTDDEWQIVARQLFNDAHGAPSHGYDPDLGKAITNLDLEGGPPDMWPQFDALKNVPVLTIRGELSDLLSEETVNEMADRHPRMEICTVPRQGHAPLLRDDETIAVIREFLMRHDAIPEAPYA